MEPRISLIIPAFNEERRIGDCISSAIENSGSLFSEILVINNASTDETQKIAEGFPGVRVVYEKEKGLTRARQCAYRHATEDVLAFVDADTRIPKGWGEQIREAFKDEDLACLSGPYFYYDLPRWQSVLVWLYWRVLGYPTYLLTGYMAVGGNFAIRKSVLDKMKGFDTSIEFYGEDTDIARRASAFGKVRFSLAFVMSTSGRRLAQEGFFRIGYLYVANFLSEVFFGRPSHADYNDIR
jgi:glycosyltransferase involved in cell wall biosynthesis